MEKCDKDHDGMISRDEFEVLTKMDDFEDDVAWDALFPDFTEEQLAKFAEKENKAVHTKHKDHIDPAMVKAGQHAQERVMVA